MRMYTMFLSALYIFMPTIAFCVDPDYVLGKGKWTIGSNVCAIAATPFGKTVCLAGVLDTVGKPSPCILSHESGDMDRLLVDSQETVVDCFVSDDKHTLVSASLDGRLRCWDLQTRKELVDAGTKVSFAIGSLSPSVSRQSFLVIAQDNNDLHLFNTGTMQGVRIAGAMKLDHVSDAAISRDGSMIAVISAPSTLKLFSSTGELLCTESLGRPPRARCRFDGSGFLWVGSDWDEGGDALQFEIDKDRAGIWRLALRNRLQVHWPMAFDADGRVAALDNDDHIVVYDGRKQPCEVGFRSDGFREAISALDFSFGFLCAGDSAGNCWRFREKTWKLDMGNDVLGSIPTTICFDDGGATALIGTTAGTIIEWNIGNDFHEIGRCGGRPVKAIVKSDCKSKIVTALIEREYREKHWHSIVYEVPRMRQMKPAPKEVLVLHGGDHDCMAEFQGNRVLISGAKDGELLLCDLSRREVPTALKFDVDKLFCEIQVDSEYKNCVLLTTDSHAFVAKCSDFLMGYQLHATNMMENVSAISKLAVDGTCIVGCEDGQVRVVNANTIKTIFSRKVFESRICHISVIADGKYAVAFNDIGEMAMVSIANVSEPTRIIGKGEATRSLAFSDLTNYLAVGRTNGTVDVYRVKTLLDAYRQLLVEK